MNRKLLRDFRLYMLVGGMPQAVNEYIQTNNFRKVERIKRDILSLYTDDFKKIDPTGKLFLCDTSLFTTLMFRDKDFTENIIYEKLLNDKLSANFGYLYKNMAAQILAVNGNELFYYTMMNERTRRNYEIDFLLARRNKICPIEVKSSGYKTHSSRDAFSQKFSDQILHKYLVYTKDLGKDADIICLPIYMVPFL